ncbi:hypothetical protein GTP41_17895 [Pseudoduganella sp. DS3]|uniref:Lipoprotein n=1 Tax=Pseudoduganella guangdongensis TaxID=2692179 RepID=A0A6N9HKW2_9BURK|nr:hypothetical protein [Pseudoduganella guangdongensis]MYN03969.1 hypothetical protein [Pseudoduganella guangdongensis]
MIKALTAVSLCLLFAGCASDPASNDPSQAKATQQRLAQTEEREEVTGSHLRRKRSTENVAVADREAVERAGRPSSNLSLPSSGGR